MKNNTLVLIICFVLLALAFTLKCNAIKSCHEKSCPNGTDPVLVKYGECICSIKAK